MSKKKVKFLKECLFEIFEDYRKRIKKGVMIPFSYSFINSYLSKEIIKEHPDFSKIKIVDIQTLIKKFLNYLVLQKVLEKRRFRKIIDNLYNKSTLKRKIDDYSKLKKVVITDKKSKQAFLFNNLSMFYKSCLTSKGSIKKSYEMTLNEIGVSKKEYNKYLKKDLERSENNNLDALQENLVKKFNKDIKSPSYYFPDKREYILKNWFSYEFTTFLVGMLEEYFFDDDFSNTSDIILLENYVKFCFNLSVRITRTITSKLTITFFSKDLILKELEKYLKGNLFFQENNIDTSKTEIINSVYRYLKQWLKFCHGCPNNCLISPYDKCTMFEDPLYTLDFSEEISSNRLFDKIETPLPEIHYSQKEILKKTKKIYLNMLNSSKNVSEGNFTKISVEDLKFLFEQYNKDFFSGLLEDLLNKEEKCKLVFRLSSRMTKSGGSTTKIIKKDQVIYKISISSYLLFQSFLDIKRTIRINGIICKDRIEALQRIFEHELIHLLELLIKGDSSCSSDGFKTLAKQIFLHTDNTHELITQKERAFLKFSIKVGDKVSFEYNKKTYIGIVDRITKRATVLVKDNEDSKYANEEGFMKFYIPISMLIKEE
ncbi:MAG: SprT-like domain-containing protein [Promethearchaeota archaeon]